MYLHNRLLILILTVATSAALADEKIPTEVTRYLRTQGPVIDHRLFRSTDPQEQMLVSFCVDENLKGGANEGANNPANLHCEVALFNRKSIWVLANRVSIGHGSVRKFRNGVVRVETISYLPEDSLCCPSKKQEVLFTTTGGKLVAFPQ